VSRQTLAYSPYPFFGARGEAQHLWDLDGNCYLDLVNNYTSLIHGHGYPPSVDAALAQLQQGGALGVPTQLELQFGHLLASRFPVIEQLRFALSGSEAATFALRVARAHTRRTRLLKFEGGFHGSHDEMQRSVAAAPLEAGSFGTGEANSAGLGPAETLVAVYNDRQSVAAAFEAHGDSIAAVIAEPFLGNSGLIAAEPGFLSYVKSVARAHGALLILDEIQSMRLSYGGAEEMHGVEPDIVLLGKIMGGGMPLAAYGAAANIMECLDGLHPNVPQTGTFNGFSASLAAGMAAMRDYDRTAIDRLNAFGDQLRKSIAGIFAAQGLPVTINGQGSMFNIILAEGPMTRYSAWRRVPTELWSVIHWELLANGIYMIPRGTGCLSTPMTGDDLDRFLSALDDALVKALGRVVSPATALK
jgi:glutamate-1-semialdehyde 2,1-aminomutase